jgi:hypothetical protein
MKVYQTGIRSGEFITSAQGAKQNKGSILQIRGIYPPSKVALPNNNYDWSILSQQLEVIPFFSKLSFADRKEWLIRNSTPDDDLYIQDVPLQVRIVQLSGTFFNEKLDERTISTLIKGNPNDPEGYWDISYIYNLIPRKPGSRAKRHTLIFRPGNWTIHNLDTFNTKSFTGLVIDIDIVSFGYVVDESIDYIVPVGEGNILGIRAKSSTQKITLPDESSEIVKFLSWASPSIHKSLIQKIIRTGANRVDNWSGDMVLMVSFIMLLNHPGAFVPDIQRFVTGQESALKRLAISICEDSYTDYPGVLMSLLAGALLTQVNSNWKPTIDQINTWLAVAVASRADKRYYQYSTKVIKPINYNPSNIYQLNHLLISTIKSFQTDIIMVGTIDGSYSEGHNLIESIPFIHSIDHHNITDIGYYFPKEICLPYPEVFKFIWDKSSGINPRKDMKFDDNLILIREAQKLVYLTKTFEPQQRKILNSTTTINYTLDDSWISGMIGPITVKIKSKEYLVSLHPENIYTYVVIKRPSRGDKDLTQLSQDLIIEAEMKAREQLYSGIPLKIIPQSLPLFTGGKLYFRNDEYIIHLNGEFYPWNIVKHLTKTFNNHDQLQLTLENSIKWIGLGIEMGADMRLRDLIGSLTQSVRQRISVHLSSNRSILSMFKISRDGTGQEYSLSPDDTAVFHFFSYLCILYPGAISKLGTREFKISYGPVIWKIQEQLTTYNTITGTVGWGQIYDRLNRKMWPHQELGWQRMLSGRGHLLWFPVGLGKTMIVLRYIQELIHTGKMPKFLVYTLPPSAVENTIREVSSFGFNVNLMDFRKQSDQTILKPYSVNLVKHDHLRLSQGVIHQFITETLFVVDEFHLTLNKTIRTSMALELAKTSYDFIGLTGTITQSENVEDLIQWLQQIVTFEVTVDNFWSAASMMVSGRIQTGVTVNRHEIEILMNEDYYKLVGVPLGGSNPNPSAKDFRAAVDLCQKVCLIAIADATIDYYNQGETIFAVTKDIFQQNELKNLLLSVGLPEHEIILLDKDTSIALTSESNSPIRVIITTIRHSTGYTSTKSRIMLTSVYFSNQATREQLEGRINRIGQKSPEVWIITFHSGILTHILKRYDQARSLSQALKQLAPEINLDSE